MLIQIGRFFSCVNKFYPKCNKGTLGQSLAKIYMSDLKIFNQYSSGFHCQYFDNFPVVKKRVGPRGTKFHWVDHLQCFFSS